MADNLDNHPLAAQLNARENAPLLEATFNASGRLVWTPELRAEFERALAVVGGGDARAATPRAVLDAMRVEGLTLRHVQPHLHRVRQRQRQQQQQLVAPPNADGGAPVPAAAAVAAPPAAPERAPLLRAVFNALGRGVWTPELIAEFERALAEAEAGLGA